MEKKDWQRNLDNYLTTGKLDCNEYSQMNETEQEFIQELKRSFKRIINKNENIPSEE